MTYKIEFSNTSKFPLFLKDGEKNNQTPITMFGKGTLDYGYEVWTNFIRYLENWCGDQPPNPALEGMLWFNKTSNTLMINTSKDLYNPSWEAITNKVKIDTSNLLKKAGGSLSYDLQLLSKPTQDNHAVNKEYVDGARQIPFTSNNAAFQYNFMNYNGFGTMNTTIDKKHFVDGKCTVLLPREMKDTVYNVFSTVGSKKESIGLNDTKYHFYVTNKTKTAFTLNIDTSLPEDCEMQISIVGFVKT